MTICPLCQSSMADDADFCGICGGRLDQEGDAAGAPSRISTRSSHKPAAEEGMSAYLTRLIVATLMAAAWGIGGGFAIWYMWQYVVNAYETWDYFPRGMFIIPAGITFVWGASLALFLWFWVNCLFNTKSAQETWEERTQGDSGSDTEAAGRERGSYKLLRAACPHCAGRRETLGWVFGIPLDPSGYVWTFVCEDHKGAAQAMDKRLHEKSGLDYEGAPDKIREPVEVKCVLCLTSKGTTHADPNKGSWWFLCNDCEPRARELIETAEA